MLSLPTHIPVPSTPALPSSPLLEDCIEKGKKGIWSFGACGSWLHSLCKMTAGCIQPGRSLVCLGQVKTYYTCNTWELTGSAQRARCVLDVLQLLFMFFSKFVDSTSCMLATWAVPTLPSRNVGPLFSDFF